MAGLKPSAPETVMGELQDQQFVGLLKEDEVEMKQKGLVMV